MGLLYIYLYLIYTYYLAPTHFDFIGYPQGKYIQILTEGTQYFTVVLNILNAASAGIDMYTFLFI
jgi:hypothetical protein